MIKHVVLFTFHDKRSGRDYAIEGWQGYGVTCPALWTTNGNAHYTAQLLLDGIGAGFFEMPEGWRHETHAEMMAALREAYFVEFPDRRPKEAEAV